MWTSISSARSKLRTQILRLEQGFPQNWIFIDREVRNSLIEKDQEGVKASQNFIDKYISEIFHQDLLNIFNQNVAKIRPVIGPNGGGKTTLLKFRVKKHLQDIAPFSNLFLFFDFKSVTDNINEFWSIFLQKFFQFR